MDSAQQPPVDLSLGELSQAVDQAGVVAPQAESAVEEEPRRKRRHHRHKRRSRSGNESSWKLSQEAKAWIVLLVSALALSGGAFWVFFLYRENDTLRSKLSQESFANKERLVQIEARMQAAKVRQVAMVELEHERFNSIEPLKPTRVKRPPEGTVVLHLRLPPLQPDRWELILRDRLQNSRARMIVSHPMDRTLSVAISDLDNNVYEVHLKARGDETTYRYMFSMY